MCMDRMMFVTCENPIRYPFAIIELYKVRWEAHFKESSIIAKKINIFFAELSDFFGCRSEKFYFEYWGSGSRAIQCTRDRRVIFVLNFIQVMVNKQFNFTFRSSRSFQLMELKKMWAMISLASSAPPPNRLAGSWKKFKNSVSFYFK